MSIQGRTEKVDILIKNMKQYIISNAILAPFTVAAYFLSQNSPILSSIVLLLGFTFSICYYFKQYLKRQKS